MFDAIRTALPVGWIPVHDHQFTANLTLSLPLVRYGVPDVHHLKVKPLKHPPDIRVIVDADHHLAFAAARKVGHALIVLERTFHAIAGGMPVRRVQVVKGMGTVVTFSTFKPGEIFDVGAGQALPGGREVFLDPQQVDSRTCGSGTKRLSRHLAGKAMVLQIEKTGGALDVGEGFGTGHLLPLEYLARTERPFELAHEFFQVVLHNAVQRHQVTVDVFEDFNRRGLGSHEVERGAAGKDFDVAFVGWEVRDKAVGQAAFAAHPRDDGCGHIKARPLLYG